MINNEKINVKLQEELDILRKKCNLLEKQLSESQKQPMQTKKSGFELLSSEILFKTLFFENHSVMLLVEAENGQILDANEAASAFYGWSHEDLLKRSIFDINTLPEKYLKQEVQKALKCKKKQFEFKHRTANGEIKDVEIFCSPFELDSKKVLFSIIFDITQRKLSENLINGIIDLNPFSIQIVDAKGHTVSVNAAHTQLFGSVPAPTYSVFDDVLVQRQNLDKEFDRLRNGEIVDFPEFYYNTHELDSSLPDKPIWLQMTAFPLIDSGGKPNAFVLMHKDITISRKTNDELQRSLQTSADIVSIIPSGLFIYRFSEPDLLFLENANESAYKLTGIRIDQWRGKEFSEIWPEAKKLGICDHYLNVMKTGELFETDDLYYADDRLQGAFRIKAFRLPEKKLAVAFENITEIKKAEYALKESEERFRALHNASFGGIAIHDNGIIKECNLGLAEMTGYSMDELIGMNGLLLCSPECREEVLMKINNESTIPYEAVALKKNGQKFPIRIEARNIPFKGKIHRVTEFRDITDIKKAEENLRQSLERIQALLDANPDMMFVFNSEGKILDYHSGNNNNDLYTKPEFFIGKPIADIMPENVASATNKIISKILRNGGTEQYEYELDINGNSQIFEARCVSCGKNEILSIVRNITRQKHAEQELINAKVKAEESDHLKSAFLANMSHEIRTPMNGILGFAELLKEPGLSGQEQKEYIQIIEESGERMLRIINDIIDISKIESGLMKVYFKETNVNDQLDYIYNFFRPEIEAKGLIFEAYKTCPRNETYIVTDPEKLYAILTNLVKNAIKYTKQGKIKLGYMKKEDSYRFYVSDTGIGIAPERQKAVFERFIQADIEDRQAYQGAGLGLAISQAYVEMLGGTIGLEHSDQSGSVFYFTLPYKTLKKMSEQPEKSNISEDNNEQPRLKVLIAEDDAISERLIEYAISGICKEILLAKNGIDAVSICRDNPDIDLILMDIRMPGINGHEATRQIREFNTQVIIIAQTAFGLEGDKEKALDAGCNDYMAKPIKKADLLKKINRIMK